MTQGYVHAKKIRKCGQKLITLIAILAVLKTAAVGEKPIDKAQGRPLKVYILAGQSNMQGQAKDHVLPSMAKDPATRSLYEKIVDESGKPRVYQDVCVAAFSQSGGWGKEPVDKQKHGPLTVGFGGDLIKDNVFGPELAFGITMVEKLKEPILIIKTSWGGKSLNTDFRPPTGGPYEFSEIQKKRLSQQRMDARAEKTGHYYRLMMKHVRTVLADPGKYCAAYDPKQGIELAGFVWFQGFNDMVDGETYPEDKPDRFKLYSDLLGHFIRDVRKELNAPNMPFVIGVIGTGGNPGKPHAFREAMAAPAALREFKDNVVAVHTAKYFDEKLGELMDRGWRWQRKQWDPENKYAALREKLLPLQKELNEAKKIEDRQERGKKQQEIQARMDDIKYTPKEQEYIKNNKSSQGFHYLGSAKTFNRIGEAFAKAMLELERK